MDDTSSYSMTTILGDTDYMPNEMKTKTLTPLYAASLSGKEIVIIHYKAD